jgi:hypothetical protein
MEDHTFYRKVDAILDEQEDNAQNSGSDSGSEDDGPDDNQYVVEAIVDDRVMGPVILCSCIIILCIN